VLATPSKVREVLIVSLSLACILSVRVLAGTIVEKVGVSGTLPVLLPPLLRSSLLDSFTVLPFKRIEVKVAFVIGAKRVLSAAILSV